MKPRMIAALVTAPFLMLTALAGAAGAWAADAPRTLTYDILMDGSSIGKEEVRIEPQGAETRVTVTASTRVKVLFLSFTYDHERQELWRDGRLESMQGKTNDDGSPHTVTFARLADGIAYTTDGKEAKHPADTLPLTLWTPAVLKSPLLLSVIDGEQFKVTVETVGKEPLDTPRGKVEAQHWRIRGGVDRDLWFAADGTLLLTTFKRRGYDISYVLK